MTPGDLARMTGQIWPGSRAGSGIAVVDADGTAMHGEIDRAFPLASVTKPLVAYAVLIAVEEGSLDLDAPLELGTSIRHLLAHASGMAPDEQRLIAPPATRRIYSNAGFEVIGDVLTAATGIAPADYVREAVLGPLGMSSTTLEGSPASGAVATAADLARFTAELLAPTLLDSHTLDEATAVQLPGLDGLLPGFGRQTPNDWGLGFELRDAKHPHWTAPRGSPRTFGHFGRSGTFLWIDPDAQVGCVYLGDTDFGPWAIDAWPAFNASVLEAAAR